MTLPPRELLLRLERVQTEIRDSWPIIDPECVDVPTMRRGLRVVRDLLGELDDVLAEMDVSN